MKLVIFGSTGSIGRQLVNQALSQGHQVTAFARSPAKLGLRHPNLRMAQGDVMDTASVEAAIRDHDAVFCALGAGRKGTLRAQGTGNIIRAMQRLGVRRLICQSSLGVGDSRGNLNAFWKYIMFGLLLRPAYADHGRQEALVRQSDLDWTIVRPGAFSDGELTGRYRHGFPGDDRSTRLSISRADVAHFMLEQLMDKTYLCRAAGLSY